MSEELYPTIFESTPMAGITLLAKARHLRAETENVAAYLPGTDKKEETTRAYRPL